ncbi:TetR/AcrR family transcriptional regulator [Salinispora mooreana]|uniref:TetR/AcrR family transcriptional regulator n=1 Tax=Salinispora mooreana TaxID=999545 RepID=UPI0003A50D95|nr:TetR/AcrR family transcriptional regulator [Salinispora mooreana]
MFSSVDGAPPGTKPATQRRSRETRDRLIAALDELLHEENFDEISVAQIANRAGVSVASIYQRFDNQNAAVAILVALYLRRVTQWWDDFSRDNPEPSSRTSLREALVHVGRAAWRQSDDLRHVMRPAYLQSRLHPDLLDEHWRRQEEAAVSGIRSLLQSHADEIRHSDLTRAASMAAYFFNMMFLGRLLHPEGMSGWDLPTDADEFAEELADFVCGYLGVARVSGLSYRGNR